jgi:8-oxo-dGTP pyrophosphatase MutT (NUDIX family)
MPVQMSQCTNCGEEGHIFRNCLEPVTSYGVIAVRYPEDTDIYSGTSTLIPSLSVSSSLHFLLIRRKDSLSFLEFIRGKYTVHDHEYISMLLRHMTQDEQQRLITYTFQELWYHIWGESSTLRSHKTNYDSSERRYLQLRPLLPDWIQQCPSPWTEPEWGFPKGRRNPHESDMHCGIREFQEETGLKRNQFMVIQNIQPISETFFGSNHVHYCHKYYLAICPTLIPVELREEHAHMYREIGDIRWCTLEDALSKIRPDNVEKREILLKAGKMMKNFYPVCSGFSLK